MGEETQVGDGRGSDSTTIHFKRTYDWSATSPSIATVTALATVTGVDQTELATEFGTTLYDHVDPEALDALVRDQKSEQVTVSFTIDHYQIWFEGDELAVRSHDQ
ncbi:HalOD1 output domain-containing protein [Natronococcus wangiae]|uniref:HalOD1 output domain-containing protein n=1 Tax=Natronococcus wangiae TaxID=3068275 RepID=UPI00273F0A98|nr:HalOD1 output domain-containing protein [Natronococcus sp. AD5]